MKMIKYTEENHKFWCTDRQDTAMSHCSTVRWYNKLEASSHEGGFEGKNLAKKHLLNRIMFQHLLTRF